MLEDPEPLGRLPISCRLLKHADAKRLGRRLIFGPRELLDQALLDTKDRIERYVLALVRV
jgi:hypothetical protein